MEGEKQMLLWDDTMRCSTITKKSHWLYGSQNKHGLKYKLCPTTTFTGLLSLLTFSSYLCHAVAMGMVSYSATIYLNPNGQGPTQIPATNTCSNKQEAKVGSQFLTHSSFKQLGFLHQSSHKQFGASNKDKTFLSKKEFVIRNYLWNSTPHQPFCQDPKEDLDIPKAYDSAPDQTYAMLPGESPPFLVQNGQADVSIYVIILSYL